MNFLSERLLNSTLAALRCHSHCSPSELKMPWPRKSSIELRRQQVAHGVVGEARLGYVLNVVRVRGDDDAGEAGGFEGGGLRRSGRAPWAHPGHAARLRVLHLRQHLPRGLRRGPGVRSSCAPSTTCRPPSWAGSIRRHSFCGVSRGRSTWSPRSRSVRRSTSSTATPTGSSGGAGRNGRPPPGRRAGATSWRTSSPLAATSATRASGTSSPTSSSPGATQRQLR